ncbi:MAG: 50S ribosomal protein L16 [Planctomycetes bacterium]|jgi:large subunit ribosomal protein L16|nr:50S ribosomal protein L16 [Planctomycetota bacterium]
MGMMPNRVKYRKAQRGRLKGVATRGNEVCFGVSGLQALSPGLVTAEQIEAGRVCATRFLAGEGRVFIRVFPAKPMTAIPLETRMGKGKGEVEYWCAPVKPGTILFEVGGASEDAAAKALRKIAHKLPVRTRLVARRKTT